MCQDTAKKQLRIEYLHCPVFGPLAPTHPVSGPWGKYRINFIPIRQAENLMDIGTRRIFNEDHDMFRENARKFFRDQLAPQHKRYEAQGHVDRQTWKVGPQN